MRVRGPRGRSRGRNAVMARRRPWVLAAGFAGVLPLTAPGGVGAQEWSYTRLDLDLRIEPAAQRLEVSGSGALVLGGAATDEIRLFLNTRGPAMQVRDVTTPGMPSAVAMTTDGHRQLVRITLDAPAAPGDTVPIAFRSHWVAPSSQLLVTDSVALGSWVEAWYPIPAGSAGPRWAAPGTTRFQLPSGWQAVTNGALLGGADEEGWQVWHTAGAVHRSFAAAPYRMARTPSQDRDIAVFLLTADTASARRQAETLARAIEAMEQVWGPYPYDGYAIAEIPTAAVTWAASSEQGFIMAVSSQFGEDGNLPLFAHEAAHGWWGNRVASTGPGGQMVTEALAQYGAVVAIEALEGTDAMNEFLRFSRPGYNRFQSAHGYFEIIRRGGDKPLSQLGSDTWDHNLSDAKGHWFYHMLRHRLGSDRFFAVLRDLQRQYSGRALSLAELRRFFLDAAPDDAGLPRFMEQWLDRTGAPQLDVKWWTTADGRGVHLELTQLQAEPYDLALTIELLLGTGHRLRREIRLTDARHVVALETHARVVGLTLDPDHRLLFWRPEYGRPTPIDTTRSNQ